MKQCPICEKGTIMARRRNLLRGKYNPTIKKRRYPNLQWAALADGKRIKICASCLKQGLHLKKKQKNGRSARAVEWDGLENR